MEKIERRYIAGTELRVADGKKIVGYAALFNTRSQNLGGFVEQIAPGAFKDALAKSDIRALFNHDPNYVLGRKQAGTLSVSEDAKGLPIEITPPDTQWARDLLVSIDRGDISGTSFGFRVAAGGSVWDEEDGVIVRTITKVAELLDVSPVTYPAYPDASIALRSMEEWKEQIQKAAIEAAGADTDTLRRRLALEVAQ